MGQMELNLEWGVQAPFPVDQRVRARTIQLMARCILAVTQREVDHDEK